MNRWSSRVALVTGAGSGIGACIATNLANSGMIVVGCARNIAPIDELAGKVTSSNGKLISYKCDLSQESEIETMFGWINKNHGGVDVLINNAGYATMTPLLEITGAEMEGMLKINVTAAVLCAKLAVKSMLDRNVNDGHIFNISSILGHSVIGIMNFYSATKFAITALTQGLRKELAEKGSRIKVTAISPGRTETNFHFNMMGEKAKNFYSNVESLESQNVSDALIYALSAPESVQVYDVQLQPTNIGNLSAYKS